MGQAGALLPQKEEESVAHDQEARLNVIVRLDAADCRQWLVALAERLRAAGRDISFDVNLSGTRAGPDLGWLDRIEAGLYGNVIGRWRPIAPEMLPRAGSPAPDAITLDLSGRYAAMSDYHLRLDGAPGIAHAEQALIAGHVPFVEIIDRNGRVAASGLPAIEDPDILSRALDLLSMRLTSLFAIALDRRTRPEAPPRGPDRNWTERSALGFAATTFRRRLLRKLAPARLHADWWRIGIRRRDEAASIDGDRDIEGFHWLADDGTAYYADPILWFENGQYFLFLEAFPIATARGVIAVAELDETGRALAPPRPIIERTGHLSYPFLFRHDGAIYMIPENAAENHLPLYRARRFPDAWDYLGPLIDGIALHDATLVAHDGAWWILANEAREGGSSWDCLCVFRADNPLGPYTPHRQNPVLIDARTARSGGPAILSDRRLIRPVQSCLAGYGRFIRFMEVEHLSDGGFSQRERGRIIAPPDGPIAGVHTYSAAGQLEAIDALTPRAVIP